MAKTGNTTDALATVVDFLFVGFGQAEIITENTGGANSLDVDVQVSENGANYVSHQGYPKPVVSNGADVFASSVAHRHIRVQIKSTSAGLHTTYRIQPHMER